MITGCFAIRWSGELTLQNLVDILSDNAFHFCVYGPVYGSCPEDPVDLQASIDEFDHLFKILHEFLVGIIVWRRQDKAC